MTPESPVNSASPQILSARALRLSEKAGSVEAIRFGLGAQDLRSRGLEDAIVEVRAAAVNPSDVKAALGMMPHAIFPRTPGRDFAGVVVEGPAGWVGREVFGSSGALGIRLDGSHATHLVVEAAALVDKPAGLSMEEAAGLGVPFVTAMEGYLRAGMPRAGDTVLILGLSGKVGQAAAQVAAWQGARVIGVNRRDVPPGEHAGAPVETLNAQSEDLAAQVRALTEGRGADIVFNTVGEPYYQIGADSLALGGRMILIAALRTKVEFDIFSFYRGQQTYVGIDTLAMSSVESGARLRDLLPGLASGALKPFPILDRAVHGLSDAARAYAAVIGSSRDRVILRPGD